MILRKRIPILIALAAISMAFAIVNVVPASYVYSLRCEFTTLPEHDDALRDWLSKQPGVVPHTVHIVRDESHHRVEATFIQSRRLTGHPPLPRLDAACRELGYVADGTGWRDARGRESRP